MKEKKIMVRMTDEMYNDFKKASEDERRNVSDLLRIIIGDYLVKKNKKK